MVAYRLSDQGWRRVDYGGVALATNPMQPIEWVNGVIRFKSNKIIEWLWESGKIDLNQIAIMTAHGKFSEDDQMQLAQLIGYSVSGFGDLSYASKESIQRADEIAQALLLG